MRKVTYWMAECLNDSPVYSIRTKLKKEAEALLAKVERKNIKLVGENRQYRSKFGPLKKVVVEYASVLDLVFDAQSEGGLFENDCE